MSEGKKQYELKKISKSDAIKRSLKAHMVGINSKGLIFKSLEKLAELVKSSDDSVSLAAIDKVVKLLPYCVSREDSANPNNPQTQAPLNVQINFDSQVTARLQGTKLEGLLENLGVVREVREVDGA